MLPTRRVSPGGGDIYYLTSCASGRISRFLLADVSGHGEQASQLALGLRDLLRDNVNKVSQKRFVEGMNRQFGNLAESSGFATAVVATFFEPNRGLSISVAGHPYPLYYRASKRQWFCLYPAKLDEEDKGNLPLGVHHQSVYPGRKVKTEPRDMFLLYSDAFSEAVDESDQMLGIRGVLELLNQSGALPADQVIPYLREEVVKMGQGNLADDDATLILGHFNSTKVRLRDNLLAPFRLLGNVTDRTQLNR